MSNFKTQQVDIKTSAGKSTSVLPTSGHILPFAGPSDKIPTGWILCDGTNGTPDLRGKIPGGISSNALNVGDNQIHSHTFSHSLGNFNSGQSIPTSSISSASTGNNQNTHTHNANAYVNANAWGDSGPANRSNGTQANVIGRTHTHGGTTSSSTNFNTGNNSSNHTHGFNSYSISSTSSNTHNHSISSSPNIANQNITHNSLPSIFYVNFIMKV